MTNEEIAITLNDHENEIKSLKYRMSADEDRDKTMTELTTSVKVLATNMEFMAKEQQKQGERLQRLENIPAENFKHLKQTIISSICTAVIGGLIGYLISLLF
jgi:hypothetical protein